MQSELQLSWHRQAYRAWERIMASLSFTSLTNLSVPSKLKLSLCSPSCNSIGTDKPTGLGKQSGLGFTSLSNLSVQSELQLSQHRQAYRAWQAIRAWITSLSNLSVQSDLQLSWHRQDYRAWEAILAWLYISVKFVCAIRAATHLAQTSM